MAKVTEAQRRAADKWDNEHKERRSYTSHRSRAFKFVSSELYTNQPDYLADLKELKNKTEKRINELQN